MDDLTELEAMADAIAMRRNDGRSPAVVRRAFVRPCAVTLRVYLVLEELDSPVLHGKWPWEDARAMRLAMEQAWGAIFPNRELPGAAELGQAIGEMVAEVQRGFSTVMAVRFPTSGRLGEPSLPVDALGWVARLWARLVAAGVRDAVDLPLDQAFILSASLAVNEGAECTGEEYGGRSLTVDS